jgi:hypothetical protein
MSGRRGQKNKDMKIFFILDRESGFAFCNSQHKRLTTGLKRDRLKHP